MDAAIQTVFDRTRRLIDVPFSLPVGPSTVRKSERIVITSQRRDPFVEKKNCYNRYKTHGAEGAEEKGDAAKKYDYEIYVSNTFKSVSE